MLKSILAASFVMFQLVIFTPCLADLGDTVPAQSSATFEAYKNRGKQCFILNRSNPNFERELLLVPPEACVIFIGSWIIKTDYLFKALEIISPKSDSWHVKWKDLDSPLSINNSNSWSFSIKTKGVRQIMSSITYHF